MFQIVSDFSDLKAILVSTLSISQADVMAQSTNGQQRPKKIPFSDSSTNRSAYSHKLFGHYDFGSSLTFLK
jgi:hypothetical protein